MTAVFRVPGASDRDRAERAIKRFLDRFDGASPALEEVVDLAGKLRDVMLEKDCDGDTDLFVLAIDRRYYRYARIVRSLATSDWEGDLDAEIEKARALLARETARLTPVPTEIASTISVADPSMDRRIHERALMPAEVPEGLPETLRGLVEGQFSRGVLVSEDGGWPKLHPSVVVFLSKVFHAACEAAGARDLEPVMYQRSRAQGVVIWPYPDAEGNGIGRWELQQATSAFEQVTGALSDAARKISQLMSWQESVRHRKEEEARIAAERDRIRQGLKDLPGLLDGLSDPASARVRGWIEEGNPFSVTVFRRERNPASAAVTDEIRAWLGEEHCGIARKAFHVEGAPGLEALKALAGRMREISAAASTPSP